ncbi:hypothetical protein AX774_g2545 [Zancudomyces culisetae]|uniref:Uncharacterized protein n=1 Tax=Zancudomyces culisetae TaxID=1213189 RepID=A0A1R1PSL6_ZANCU|nr:hypothetical protein AX774_g2545 [Zancudomyces culisetae]|eukprot:OMH83941.1 hypothetical protein AX774_g2545 [Zancudomyces culisetae]
MFEETEADYWDMYLRDPCSDNGFNVISTFPAGSRLNDESDMYSVDLDREKSSFFRSKGNLKQKERYLVDMVECVEMYNNNEGQDFVTNKRGAYEYVNGIREKTDNLEPSTLYSISNTGAHRNTQRSELRALKYENLASPACNRNSCVDPLALESRLSFLKNLIDESDRLTINY